MKRKSLSFLYMLTVGFLSAQENKHESVEMVTDRPDATESSRVVPKGTIQVETGGFYESYKDMGVKSETWVYNTSLLRYGLLDNLELRLGWDVSESIVKGNNRTISAGKTTISPLLFGVKLGITEEENGMPEIAFIGHLQLPFTASKAIRPETTGVDFRFALSHTLNEKSSIAYNLGAQWADDSPEMAYVYTVAYGYSLSGKIAAFVELYGDLPENSNANHLWDAGVTYLLKPNLQLDASFGTSITEGQDILLSAGLSFRLPN